MAGNMPGVSLSPCFRWEPVIAHRLDPDVPVIDEVLAVGDAQVYQKCVERIQRMRTLGKTLLFVSHATQLLEDLCDRALWLDHGELVLQGKIREVADAYHGRAAFSAGN